MGSFFTLELDTSSPQIVVQTQTRVLFGLTIEVVVTSNEPLAEYQKVYIIDTIGIRHDYILGVVSPTVLSGFIDLTGCPVGAAELVIELMDEVDNRVTVSTPMAILSAFIEYAMYIDIVDSVPLADIFDFEPVIHITDIEPVVDIDDIKPNILILDKIPIIEIVSEELK